MSKPNLNTYNLIRSKEIREHYEKIDLSIEESIAIIKSSYTSLIKQRNYLKQLLWDKNDFKELIDLYELMIKLFFSPEEIYPNSRFFYIVEEKYFLNDICNNIPISKKLELVTKSFDIYENIDEVIRDKAGTSANMFNVSLFVINDNNPIFQPICFHCANVAASKYFCPFQCTISDEYFKEFHLEKGIELYNDNMYRFNLPFKNGDKIKIQLPGMDNPIRGILWKEIDRIDCWYNYLCDERYYDSKFRCDSLDLSYDVFVSMPYYSKLDWVEKE